MAVVGEGSASDVIPSSFNASRAANETIALGELKQRARDVLAKEYAGYIVRYFQFHFTELA